MTTTPHLGLTLVDPNQTGKATTINQALADLDAALAASQAVDLSAAADPYALASPDPALRAWRFVFSGQPAAHVVEHPAAKHFFLAENAGAFALTIKVAGQTGVTLAAGAQALLYCDGSDVALVVTAGAAPANPVDLAVWLPGSPATNQVLLRHVFTREVDFAAALAGSQGSAGTAATAETDFDVQKNGASIGTVRFAAAGTVASFIAASAVNFAAGDVLKLVAPAVPDATLADISITLAGTR